MSNFRDKLLMGMAPREYLRSFMTPGNGLVAVILAVGIPVIVYRFMYGLAATTNLTQQTPWGIWIGIDMLSGIALAAGGFTIAATVYLLGVEKYHPIVRPAVLTGFLGYIFAVIGLLADLGSPWRLPVPVFYSFGTKSIMFEVAWCVFLYSTVLFLEFTPALFEWLDWPRARRFMLKLTIGLTVAGVILSTLHQSSLGALFLMAQGKLHPLWYSPYIPLYFFVSAITAGLSMVIVESSLSHKLFGSQIDPKQHVNMDDLTIGLSRAAAVLLFAYFFVRLQGLVDANAWEHLPTRYGLWYLMEIVGFVLVPSLLYAYGARNGRMTLLRVTAGWTVLGVVVMRLNVSVIAMNWQVSPHYFPSWMEMMTTVTIIAIGISTFRWIVNRMPVLHDDPRYAPVH
jgi:Ni/Fe-hydrogenase subunit HybB-like protein